MIKQRTLLVDAQYLLKKSFSGNKNTYTSVGHIGGLYSFMTSLRMYMKNYKPHKVVLAWDGANGGIYRQSIDRAYKANRKNKKWSGKIELSEIEFKREAEKDESILFQKKRIQAYCEELYIRQIEVENIEADDLIAQYVMDNTNQEDITLYTNDRDFCQLLDYDITIKFNNIKVDITKSNFKIEFGYNYKNALPFKIMSGDAPDNIKGVEGIGEKSLMRYIPELKHKSMTVREICLRARQINEERLVSKPKKKEIKSFVTLLNSVERLKLNYRLINLSEPFLNDEAIEEIKQLVMPLDDKDENGKLNRGSKYLLQLMKEDEFMTIYSGSFNSYVEPFYNVILSEKKKLKEYEDSI